MPGLEIPVSNALTRFHEEASDALSKLSDRLPAETKIALVAYTPGNPEMDIVLKDNGLSVDEVISTLRRRGGLSIDGDNAYKRDLCDAIVGMMAFGAQDHTPPPEGHWGQRFWDIGREERASTKEVRAEYGDIVIASGCPIQGDLIKHLESLSKDSKLYRFVSQLAWYVDQAAFAYNIGNAKSPWAGERAPVDADDVEAAVIAAMETTPNPA